MHLALVPARYRGHRPLRSESTYAIMESASIMICCSFPGLLIKQNPDTRHQCLSVIFEHLGIQAPLEYNLTFRLQLSPA